MPFSNSQGQTNYKIHLLLNVISKKDCDEELPHEAPLDEAFGKELSEEVTLIWALHDLTEPVIKYRGTKFPARGTVVQRS